MVTLKVNHNAFGVRLPLWYHVEFEETEGYVTVEAHNREEVYRRLADCGLTIASMESTGMVTKSPRALTRHPYLRNYTGD